MFFLKLTESTHKMIVDVLSLLGVRCARRITEKREEVDWRIGESILLWNTTWHYVSFFILLIYSPTFSLWQHVCSNPDHLALLTEMFPEHSREEIHRVLLMCKGDLDSCSQMLLDHLGPQSGAQDTSQKDESMEVRGILVWEISTDFFRYIEHVANHSCV